MKKHERPVTVWPLGQFSVVRFLKEFKEFLKWFFTMSPRGDGFQIHWNTLPSRVRYFGFKRDWYDGPMYSFGIYFWHMTFIPNESSAQELYPLRAALWEAVESNPTLFLISDNKLLRDYAQQYLKEIEDDREDKLV